jgi:hypothetical protein
VTRQHLGMTLRTLELVAQSGEMRLARRIDGLEHQMYILERRFMVRFGGMLAIAVATLGAIIKL